MNRPLRQAYTLIEMLIVIAIVGILIALLLPAVQSARESARRASCQNNLMQLALALQLHHQTHQALPAGVRDDAGPIRHEPKGKHYSWLTQVLPYVEQANAQAQIDFTSGVYDRKNLPVRRLEIRVFACPSHRTGGHASDYAGCHHDVEAPIDADNQGVLFLNSAVRFDQISDGRSHTLFLGEKLTEEDAEKALPEFFEAGQGLDAAGFLVGDGSVAGEGSDVPAENPQPPIEEPPPPVDPLAWMIPAKPTDFGWMSGTRATLRNTGTPINERRRLKNVPASEEQPLDEAASVARAAAQLLHVGGFESNHFGGAQFAFGDGSVRYLSQQISSQVYQQLGHRADGKLLDAAAF